MPNFEQLAKDVNDLAALLKEPQQGLGTWHLSVGEKWKAIVEAWGPMPSSSQHPPVEGDDYLKQETTRFNQEVAKLREEILHLKNRIVIAKQDLTTLVEERLWY